VNEGGEQLFTQCLILLFLQCIQRNDSTKTRSSQRCDDIPADRNDEGDPHPPLVRIIQFF